MSNFTMSCLIVGILALLLYTPFCMARGVSKIAGESGTLDVVLCALPLINLARAEKLYYGKFRLCTISPIVLIVAFVARMYIWRNMYTNVTMGNISMLLFWAAILFCIVSNIIFVYTVIHDAEAMSGFKLIFISVAYPFGQYYVGTMLSNVIRHMQEKEATFK